MKRSEMLEKMHITSNSFSGQCIGPDFTERFLNAMLTTIEENGMIPPQRKAEHPINDIYLVNSWEEE